MRRSQASLACFHDLLKINTQVFIKENPTKPKMILIFTKLFLLKYCDCLWNLEFFFNIMSQEDKMKDLNAYQKLLPDINHMPLCAHRTICFLHAMPRPSFIRQCFPFSNPLAFIEVSDFSLFVFPPFFWFLLLLG